MSGSVWSLWYLKISLKCIPIVWHIVHNSINKEISKIFLKNYSWFSFLNFILNHSFSLRVIKSLVRLWSSYILSFKKNCYFEVSVKKIFYLLSSRYRLQKNRWWFVCVWNSCLLMVRMGNNSQYLFQSNTSITLVIFWNCNFSP